MESRPFLPFLLLALALAGCASPSPPAAPTGSAAAASPPSGVSLPWAFEGCRELAVFFEADPAAVQAEFPAGFTPAGATPTTATVGMDAFRCESGAGRDGPVAGPSYASFWASATPPDGLKGEVNQWYVKWLATVSDPASLGVLLDAGAPVANGTVSFSALPGGAGTTCAIAVDGLGPITITAGPGAPGPGGRPARLREFTAAADGRILTWEATLERPTQTLSAGTLQVPPGTVLARIAGTERIPVAVVDGLGGGLSNGTISG